MAVTSVLEKGGRQWRGNDSSNANNRTRIFLVKLDAVPTGPDEAITADDGGGGVVPSLGDAHPDKATAKCQDVSAELVNSDDRTLWEVTCEYTTTDSNNLSDDPTDDPWEISWGSQNVREVVPKTLTATTVQAGALSKGRAADLPIVNAADDWFDPPIEEDRAILTLTLSKNKSSYDVNQAAAYINTVNSDTQAIAGYTPAIWTAKLVEYSGQERFDRGGYWRVTYRILITENDSADGNEIGWMREVINQGYNFKNLGTLYPITLSEGGKITKPRPLADDGDENVVNINYIIFGTLKATTFATLGLPTTM